MSDQDLLSELLAAAEEDLNKPDKTNQLIDVNLFEKENDEPIPSTSTPQKSKSAKNSLVHEGETDSSDDEQNKYYENQKYNQYGKDVKFLLESSETTRNAEPPNNNNTTWKATPTQTKPLQSSRTPTEKCDVYTDPVFGIRIIKPLISSMVLQERMIGREAVHMSKIKKFIAKEKIDVDWVVAGVIVNKLIKTASNGKQYCLWTLSDLHNDLQTVSVFLFGNAYKEFWKSSIGTVVGILNPDVFESKAGNKDEVSSALKIFLYEMHSIILVDK